MFFPNCILQPYPICALIKTVGGKKINGELTQIIYSRGAVIPE